MPDSLQITALQETAAIAKSAIDVMTDCTYHREMAIACDAQSLITAAMYISSRLHAMKDKAVEVEVSRLHVLLAELHVRARAAGAC